jgi:arylsulfatase A-like enzyme
MGAVAARFRGPNQPGMPPWVALANSLAADIYGAGDLGQAYEPLDGVRINGRFSLPKGIEVPRLQDRDQLRRELDRFRKSLDTSIGYQQQDQYTQAAFDLVLGGAAQRAFDLTQEPDSIRNRYGRDSLGEKALLARRLVEAGVTFVTLSDAWGHWDHHGDEVQWGGIVKGLTPMLPVLDRGITALVSDLETRGLLESTLVIVIGEFGRSPVMTKTAGRDHWPSVMSFLMAGGGVQGGQVIGATDRRGGAIQENPLGPGDLAATVFEHLDIDPSGHWTNPAGRPVPLVEQGRSILQLS